MYRMEFFDEFGPTSLSIRNRFILRANLDLLGRIKAAILVLRGNNTLIVPNVDLTKWQDGNVTLSLQINRGWT